MNFYFRKKEEIAYVVSREGATLSQVCVSWKRENIAHMVSREVPALAQVSVSLKTSDQNVTRTGIDSSKQNLDIIFTLLYKLLFIWIVNLKKKSVSILFFLSHLVKAKIKNL